MATPPITSSVDPTYLSEVLALLSRVQQTNHFNPREVSLLSEGLNGQIREGTLSMSYLDDMKAKMDKMLEDHSGHTSVFQKASEVQNLRSHGSSDDEGETPKERVTRQIVSVDDVKTMAVEQPSVVNAAMLTVLAGESSVVKEAMALMQGRDGVNQDVLNLILQNEDQLKQLFMELNSAAQ
mmetsp:Transcript_8773/g.6517  ORF Transcript_8773/g.6517 Transcript_8773/m.6517 type:complete len:181 (-) Transcript_8773:80-622(-)